MGIVFLFFVLVTSISSGFKLWQQRSLLSEFKVSSALATAVALYPVGMAGFILLPSVIGVLGAALVSLVFFVPGITLARKAQQKLQRSGTDRTKSAESLAATVFITGLGCILYFFVGLGISVASQYSSNSVFG